MKNILLAGFLGMLLLSGCEHEEKAEAPKGKFVLSDTMMRMVTIDTVSLGKIDDHLVLSGEVSFNENNVIKIFPANSGQVVKAPVTLGDYVKRGQILAEVKSADIAGNYADLNSADADVAIAKREMENTEALYKNGISSDREYTEAKQTYEKALAARDKIKKLISINGGAKPNAEGAYVLSAPIDGYLVEKKVNSGSFIRPDMGDYLFSVSDLKTIWVFANIYESDIPRVKEGYPVDITTLSYPDRVFKGKITKISEVLDSSSRSLQARIELENPDMLLRPQMFARIVVNNQEQLDALCIPAAALIMLNGNQYVVVYNGKDDVHNQQVQVIKTSGDKAYISSGLEAGQRVITKNQLLVFNALINNE